MQEFIEKLIGRLEEESDYEPIDYDYCDMSCSGEEHFISTHKAISIVNQLAEEYNNSNDSMEIQIAKNYAKWLTKCGVNVTEKWLTATQQASALNEAYIRGRQDERDRFAEWQEEHNNGWITDRNPTREECGEYGHAEFQVTIPQSKGNKTITMDFVYETVRGKEVARWKWCGRLSVWEVLAWKPLDVPYQPKGE